MFHDADVVIVTAGSITSTARVAIRSLRQDGYKVGLLKIRLFRPFPREALCDALLGKKKVGVIDRNISMGCGGIFCQELRGAISGMPSRPLIYSYIAGIGGTDVDVATIRKVAFDVMKRTERTDEAIWIKEDF
jgi:pyruvate/2-oxoacid:ferredoxin oxidoreductase alpha subunit